MVPEWPDEEYIKKFRDLLNRLSNSYRFILVTGGGGVNERYNRIAKKINKVANDKLDWMGIYATRLNAQLLISIFSDKCYPRVITDPTEEIDWKEDILVGAGWKPGWSTDYDSMILAHRLGAERVIVATNTDYIFDKDPNKHKDAKPLKHLSWKELKNMVGDKWVPRMHIPLDPSATQYAEEKGMSVISLNGRKLDNLQLAIKGGEFEGTVIS